MSDTRLVYSTESGRICPRCGKSAAQCTCRKQTTERPSDPFPRDGFVRVRRETRGRKGKTVTVIFGLAAVEADLPSVARSLKQRCGTGGTVKEGVIVIQGDHRDSVREALQKMGYKVKTAGG